MNYPQELTDLFSAHPLDPVGLTNIYSLHIYLDRHLRILRDASLRAREDLAFTDRPFPDLLHVLEEALSWLNEDPERHS
jgi:hypothetical protein